MVVLYKHVTTNNNIMLILQGCVVEHDPLCMNDENLDHMRGYIPIHRPQSYGKTFLLPKNEE
jgi:hypothetical protein